MSRIGNSSAIGRPSIFWVRWLIAVACVAVAFGAALVLAPAAARAGFSLLLYGQASRIDAFGDDAVRYVALAHAVLGSVMMGWGVVLLIVVCGPFARGEREGWTVITVSALVWFVADTAFSLWSGFWQNAALNAGLAAALAAPLAATYRFFHR